MEGDRELLVHTDDLSLAGGVTFLCPKCRFTDQHSLLVWFAGRNVPAGVTPGPGRWHATGTGLANLTLRPSILLPTGCQWHGHVIDGAVYTA